MSRSITQVLANPSLRRIQLAFFGSTLGDWAYATAVTVWAYSAGGATAVGLFQAARFIAVTIAGPIGATIADRVDRKRYMMSLDAVRAVLVTIAALTLGLGGPDAAVYVLAITSAMVGASFRSAQAGLVPRLVDEPGQLTAANAVGSNLETVAQFGGPALGALLIGLTDVEVVFWVNVASYVWSLALVAAVRVPPATGPTDAVDSPDETESGGQEEASFAREVTVGFAELRRDRDLGAVALLAACQGFVWGALSVFTVLIAVSVLSSGAAGVGYLQSAMGVGTVIGGIVVLGRLAKARLGRDMALGVLGWSLPLVALAVFPSPVTAFAALVVVGVSDPWVNLGLDTIPQRIAPDRILSRVFAAVESALIGAMALGALITPLLVTTVGLRAALGVIGTGVTLLVIALLGRVMRIDERLARDDARPEHLDLLASVDLLAPLAPPVLEALARKAESVTCPAGTTVLAQGAVSDRFFVIRSGAVRVIQDGRELREEGPGEYVGEIGLLRDVRRTASVEAIVDTELVALGRADFLEAVTGVQESTRAAEEVVSRRLAV